MRRCDSAAMVPKTSDDLPDPETPVNTVSRRLGISTLTSLRLLTRAPCTRMRPWLSAGCCFEELATSVRPAGYRRALSCARRRVARLLRRHRRVAERLL